MKGKYSKSNVATKLLIHDPPTTSTQEILCVRTNDTSSDISYPNTRYVSTKSLGDGSASTIFEGFDNQEKCKVIIKKISKKECWRSELEVLKKLSTSTSGRLLKYVDYFESQRCSYIITNFYDGCDLFEHIDLNVPYSQPKALQLILEMAKCIKECHDNNVLHLDIKCENYMAKSMKLFELGKPNIVLIDFGHAEIIAPEESIHKLKRGYNYGTSYYTCPEGHFEKIYSSKSDIWSLGVCFSLLITGDYPYSGKRDEYYKNSLNNDVRFTKELPSSISTLISDSLHCLPLKRPTINQFIKEVIRISNEE